jgi:hypothetical protein
MTTTSTSSEVNRINKLIADLRKEKETSQTQNSTKIKTIYDNLGITKKEEEKPEGETTETTPLTADQMLDEIIKVTNEIKEIK